MEMDSGHKLNELAVDGGMSNSDVCMQVRPLPPNKFHNRKESKLTDDSRPKPM